MMSLGLITNLLLSLLILCATTTTLATTKPRFLHVAPLHQLKGLKQGQFRPVIESESAFHKTIQVSPYDSVSKSPFNTESFFSLLKQYQDSATPNVYTSEILSSKMKNRRRRNIVPTYISSFRPDGANFSWEAPCFKHNVGWLTYNQNKKSFTFTFESSNATSYMCSDWYLFATQETFHVKAAALRGKHTLTIMDLQESDFNSILNSGLYAFVFEDGMLGTIIDAYVAARTIYGVYFEKDKISFLANNMPDFPFDVRPNAITPITNTSLIGNGDLLGVVTLSGLNLILMYGTGSHIGHVATTLWIPNEQTGQNELFVVESLDGGIRRTAYSHWLETHIQDKQVVIFGKLKKEYQQKLNHKKALDFFLQSEHLPYGYQNIAYAWIDTLNQNYPTPLDASLVPSGLTIFGKLSPKWLGILFLEGFNMRLQKVFKVNTTCADMDCIVVTAEALNMTVQELMIVPERDDWLYPPHNQRAMVCSVFIMSMYKAAGMFPDLDIQASEFTPKDLYMLDLWDKHWERPAECLKNNDNYPYCQMLGEWYWPLPDYAGFGVVEPYSQMNQRCGASPPTYTRTPAKC